MRTVVPKLFSTPPPPNDSANEDSPLPKPAPETIKIDDSSSSSPDTTRDSPHITAPVVPAPPDTETSTGGGVVDAEQEEEPDVRHDESVRGIPGLMRKLARYSQLLYRSARRDDPVGNRSVRKYSRKLLRLTKAHADGE
jgi:hypothetical protein